MRRLSEYLFFFFSVMLADVGWGGVLSRW